MIINKFSGLLLIATLCFLASAVELAGWVRRDDGQAWMVLGFAAVAAAYTVRR